MSGGNSHEHISAVFAVDGMGRGSWYPVSTVVDRISRGGSVVSDNNGDRAEVKVRHTPSGHAFIQSVADGRWTNNLLALPLG